MHFVRTLKFSYHDRDNEDIICYKSNIQPDYFEETWTDIMAYTRLYGRNNSKYS